MTAETESPNMKDTNKPGVPHGMPVFGASGRRIIYDEDGKPCRSCNTLLDFKMVTHVQKDARPSGSTTNSALSSTTASAMAIPMKKVAETTQYARDEPPDVEQLGKASWSLLHTLAARYPTEPNAEQQSDMGQFINLFAKLYPCWFCAKDFKKYIEENKPVLESQEKFGRWLCNAHNAVNVKIGKPKFDCNLWKQRWKDGWDNVDDSVKK
ncbi:unnamed protein product [Ambrosiozyma monospora]|uniref:Unnamed protein product n=1 Tax=Ambrosiozyma monospora TaxID=43982 RepID=A0ACB5T3L8_AMBMO|nr:unnamed protein product [Ambrosiozyma monospora]